MARKMTEWPSKRGPITKIMPSDGCIGDTVPLAVGKWYDFHEFGWYMGNIGEDKRGGRLAILCCGGAEASRKQDEPKASCAPAQENSPQSHANCLPPARRLVH